MAKKSSTIHVEGFVWDEIEKIQSSQGITSRNTAIEYLVAEYRGLKRKPIEECNEIKTTVTVTEKVDIKKDPLADKIMKMEDDMLED